jgi:thiamine pyrophosphate-dependent acetolactate synthase large subunit-like protein
MERFDVIQCFAEVRGDAPAITSPGATSGMLFHADHRPATIYNMELGYTSAICLGIALATPDQRVYALEGDGSIVAGMATFATIARTRPPNLVVLVLDNGAYATGAGVGPGLTETSATSHGLAVARVAVACGIPPEQVVEVDEPGPLGDALRRAATEPGPWVIVARIDLVERAPRPNRRPAIDIVESANNLKRAMLERGYGRLPGT